MHPTKTLVCTSLLLLLTGAPALAADTDDCKTRYEALAPVAMKLPYWEFDQTEAGWRKLEDCPAEQRLLLGRYVKKQESQLRNLHWHQAQLLALSGETAHAAELARRSLNPDEAEQHPTFSWNAYVQATVEFLRNDRAAFEAQFEIHRLAAEKHADDNRINQQVLVGLAKCFGKPYKEAYGACRPS